MAQAIPPPPALPDAGEDADGEMEPLPDLNPGNLDHYAGADLCYNKEGVRCR